jgi:protein TonB
MLLGMPRPASPLETPVPEKEVRVIEVEFIEIPTANPNKTAAAPPPDQPAQTKAPDAPVKPVNKPKPVIQAPRPQTAPRVARQPQPRPARRPPDRPAQRPPSQAELTKLAAARLKGRDSDVSDRLATLREGVNQSDEDASAREPQRGTPSVTKALPQGDLSGRGVMRAPTPEYPAEAQRKIWEGTTRIMVYVNPDGTVRDATVVGSSGFPLLDSAAKRAAAGYQFSPLSEGENQIERGVIPFFFVIR